MADGSTAPIGEVTVGDEVIATDPQSGESGAKPVTMLHLHRDTELTDLTLMVSAVVADEAAALRPTGEGEGDRSTRGPTVTETVTLYTTALHPFWDTTLDEWVDAGELQVGHELLVHSDGSTGGGGAGQGTVTATVTEVDNYTGDALMRDLTIADTHTYHVVAGTTPVLVHNCGEAIVHLDPDAKHALITVRNDGEALHTEQFGGVNTSTNGVREFDPATLSPTTINVHVPLPNPGGAIAYAEVMMAKTARGQYPRYNLATQSCVTYCAQVLQAGGVSDIPTRTKAATEWLLRKHG